MGDRTFGLEHVKPPGEAVPSWKSVDTAHSPVTLIHSSAVWPSPAQGGAWGARLISKDPSR